MNNQHSNSTNEIIKCVFGKSISPYRRDFGRNRYHIARKFWALVIRFVLKNKQNRPILVSGISSFVKNHTDLFYDSLRFEYDCYEYLNGQNRDWINKFRDTDEFQKITNNTLKLYEAFYKSLLDLISELKNSFSSDNFNYLSISLEERPQPYLPTPKQILGVMASNLKVGLNGNEVLWPFRKLKPTELKKMGEIMDSIFYHTIMDKVAKRLIEFDKSYAVTFKAFKVVDDEMSAIQSFSTAFDDEYNYNLAQTKYIIETTYRRKNGDRLSSENLDRYLRRTSNG